MSTGLSPRWSWEPDPVWEGFGAPPPAARPAVRRGRRDSRRRRGARRRARLAVAVAATATAAFAGGLSTALLAQRSSPVQPAASAGLGAAGPAAGIGSSAPAVGHRLTAIAWCESGDDPTAVSPDGLYRGKYQFDLATWRSVNGSGDPALAPASVQDRLARRLLLRRGTAPWPVCGSSTTR